MIAEGTSTGIGGVLSAAENYSQAFQWPVFPLRPKDKRPLTLHGFKDASRDQAQIRDWFAQRPDANLGIATGSVSGLLVLDVDGEAGQRSLCTLEARYGQLPLTPRVKTGKGKQIYFCYPDFLVDSHAGFFPGLDIRATGGYVVAPPSIHPNGKVYQWDDDAHVDRIPLVRIPTWFSTLLSEKYSVSSGKARSSDWVQIVRRGVGEGERNHTIARLAGHLLRKDIEVDEVIELLFSWNETHCRPPLLNTEVIGIIDSIAGREMRRREVLR